MKIDFYDSRPLPILNEPLHDHGIVSVWCARGQHDKQWLQILELKLDNPPWTRSIIIYYLFSWTASRVGSVHLLFNSHFWSFPQCIMIFGFVTWEPLKYESYVYPAWANVIGWSIALSSILCMPTLAIIQILRTPGTLKEVGSILDAESMPKGHGGVWEELQVTWHFSFGKYMNNSDWGGEFEWRNFR